MKVSWTLISRTLMSFCSVMMSFKPDGVHSHCFSHPTVRFGLNVSSPVDTTLVFISGYEKRPERSQRLVCPRGPWGFCTRAVIPGWGGFCPVFFNQLPGALNRNIPPPPLTHTHTHTYVFMSWPNELCGATGLQRFRAGPSNKQEVSQAHFIPVFKETYFILSTNINPNFGSFYLLFF